MILSCSVASLRVVQLDPIMSQIWSNPLEANLRQSRAVNPTKCRGELEEMQAFLMLDHFWSMCSPTSFTYCGDFNLFKDNTVRNDKFYHPIIDRIRVVHVQLRPWVFKAASTTKIYCKLGRSWGIVLMLKSLQKQLQRRHKQQCLKIDTLLRKLMFFWTATLTLLEPTGNNVRVSFLVHQVPCTSATVWRYRRMFMQFSLRVWASKYTCRPIIANLL